MTAEQQAAYWKHYARQHENTVKAFDGLTPQQVSEMKAKLETLETEKLSADEKALKQAREEAATAARAELLPKLQGAQVQSIAATFLTEEGQLEAFMEIALGEHGISSALLTDGEVDKDKVIGRLTALYPPPKENLLPQQRWQNAGQFAPPPPPGRPGESGRAEAARRFGTQTK